MLCFTFKSPQRGFQCFFVECLLFGQDGYISIRILLGRCSHLFYRYNWNYFWIKLPLWNMFQKQLMRKGKTKGGVSMRPRLATSRRYTQSSSALGSLYLGGFHNKEKRKRTIDTPWELASLVLLSSILHLSIPSLSYGPLSSTSLLLFYFLFHWV